MTLYARLVGNIAAEIIEAPQTVGDITFQLEDLYPTQIINQLVAVSDTVRQNDIYDPENLTWSHPEEP